MYSYLIQKNLVSLCLWSQYSKGNSWIHLKFRQVVAFIPKSVYTYFASRSFHRNEYLKTTEKRIVIHIHFKCVSKQFLFTPHIIIIRRNYSEACPDSVRMLIISIFKSFICCWQFPFDCLLFCLKLIITRNEKKRGL